MHGLLRLQAEKEFHDRQACARARQLGTADLRVSDDEYLAHASWIRPAFAMLGDVRGLQVLELGCGHGMASVVLARLGARVTACDLSSGYVREARLRAQANGVAIHFAACAGEALPFAVGSFDRIFGNAILHHLDLAQAAEEIARVLKPGGVAVFCEPWGENALLRFARRYLPYPGKHRTADEKPLHRHDLAVLEAHFAAIEVQGFELVGMASRFTSSALVCQAAQGCDQLLFRLFPGLARLARYMVVRIKR